MKRTILTILIIILVGATGFGALQYWEHLKDKRFAEESAALAKKIIEESQKPGVPSQQWVEAKFPSNYRHSLTILHPDNWQFECCGDTDVSSFHKLEPIYFQPGAEISIVDLALKDCPKPNSECGVDELQDSTPDKIFERERKYLLESYQEHTMDLKNFKNPALKFTLDDFERYLINTGTGVVKIEFVYQYPAFITEFLNRLEPHPKTLP